MWKCRWPWRFLNLPKAIHGWLPEWVDDGVFVCVCVFCLIFLWYSVFLTDIWEIYLNIFNFQLGEYIFTKKSIFLKIGITFIGFLEFCNNHFIHISTSELDLSLCKKMILKASGLWNNHGHTWGVISSNKSISQL